MLLINFFDVIPITATLGRGSRDLNSVQETESSSRRRAGIVITECGCRVSSVLREKVETMLGFAWLGS